MSNEMICADIHGPDTNISNTIADIEGEALSVWSVTGLNTQ